MRKDLIDAEALALRERLRGAGGFAGGLKADRALLGADEGFAEVYPVPCPAKWAPKRPFGGLRRRPGESRSPPVRRIGGSASAGVPRPGKPLSGVQEGWIHQRALRWGRFSSAAPKASAIITHTASPIRAFIFACPRMK